MHKPKLLILSRSAHFNIPYLSFGTSKKIGFSIYSHDQLLLLDCFIYNNKVDKSADYIYTNCLQYDTKTVILQKSNKYQEVKRKNMILKCLCPHVGKCCTTMVHFIGIPLMESCSSSRTPEFLSFCPNHCYSIKLKAILYRYNM